MDEPDIRYALEAIRAAMAELEALEDEHEWFVSDSMDQLKNAELILIQEINNKNENTPS